MVNIICIHYWVFENDEPSQLMSKQSTNHLKTTLIHNILKLSLPIDKTERIKKNRKLAIHPSVKASEEEYLWRPIMPKTLL